MPIWSTEIKELETLYDSIKGQLPVLEKELDQLIKTEDPNVIMLYSRRCLEVIITDLCECELKRPRKTEPLKGIIDKLQKEEKVPSHIISSMHGLNELSTYGAHPKDFDPEQVKPVLVNLDIIIKWYLKYKGIGKDIKTKPTEEIRQDIKNTTDAKKSITIPRRKLAGWLSGSIAIIVTVFAVLFFAKIIGGNNKTENLEKSIAVLPFRNDSPSDSTTYFINGLMEEILSNLQKIGSFSKVLSRTSTEQYRSVASLSIPKIAKDLDANFIVEGSGQKYGSNYRIRVQLLDGKHDKHLWVESYERQIKSPQDIYNTQSEIAQAIAAELKATITPEEKRLIEKAPTSSLTAYDFYQRGKDEYTKYEINSENTKALENAEKFYHTSLEYDSTFAKAYTGLALVYWDKHFIKEYLSANFMDSILILCNIALNFDPQLSEVYTLKGTYYSNIGKSENAIESFNKAIKLNPSDWRALQGKGLFYQDVDLVNNIKYLQKAISINRGPELTNLLGSISYAYFGAGFPEKSKYFYHEILKLNNDSAEYYINLAWDEYWLTNYKRSIEFGLKSFAIDSTNLKTSLWLGNSYAWLGKFEEALKFYKKWHEIVKSQPNPYMLLNGMHRLGYAYWQMGNKGNAEYWFNEQIKYNNKMIEFGRSGEQKYFPYYDLAAIYAFIGEHDKAYENLKILNQKPIMPYWWVSLIKTDPLFSSIRNEPEFQQIVRDVELKYLAEHERVKKWLEEQGML